MAPRRTVHLTVLMTLVALVALTGCQGGSETGPQDQSHDHDHAAAPEPQQDDATQQDGPDDQAMPDDPAYVATGTNQAIADGIAFLRGSQLADGGWPMAAGSTDSHLGITTVVAHGLLTAGVPASDPAMARAIDYILKFVKDDGGIYDEGLRNYTTSIALMILTEVDKAKYQEQIDGALAFLKELQWDQGEGLGAESPDFGGAGYGRHQRPDLSNTQWFVESVRKAGLDPNDPAMKKALVFVSRTQGTEEAKGYWIGLPDGGFIYSPHDGGESKAGEIVLPSGEKGLKAYGSMTYAGFLSLIYAGLDKDDPRVEAARGWLARHYTLEENPELGMQGYYYYLMTMAKALRAYGEPTIVDDQDREHPWRQELSQKFLALQNDDGSWVNDEAERWYEGNPNLATPYALIGLTACKAELE